VDDAYEEQIAALIPRLGAFSAVKLDLDRKPFLPVYDINGPYDAPAFRTPKWTAVEVAFKDHAKKHDLDLIVVVIRRETGDYFTRSNQNIRGAGLYARGAGNSTGLSVLHLQSILAVIDGETGKPLVSKWLAHTQEAVGFGANIQRAAPSISAPPELSRTKTAEWTADQKSQLRAALIELPRNAWEPTLRASF